MRAGRDLFGPGVTAAGLRLRELGAFLRGRRLRLDPLAMGVDASGTRRTPGLRREEVAGLAGVSVGYYVRLEQGRGGPPSAAVLDALARALRLDPDERAHLHALADPGGNRHATRVSALLREQAQQVLAIVAAPFAAYVINRVSDVIAWNAAAAALYPGLFPVEAGPHGPAPNTVRYTFSNPAAERLFPDWAEIADDSVAHLRASIGHRPDDPALRALVAELATASPEFARRWERRDVRPRYCGRKVLEHPMVGRIELDHRVLDVPATCHHRLVVYSATPDSPAQVALDRLLAAQAAGRSW